MKHFDFEQSKVHLTLFLVYQIFSGGVDML